MINSGTFSVQLLISMPRVNELKEQLGLDLGKSQVKIVKSTMKTLGNSLVKEKLWFFTKVTVLMPLRLVG